jgi:hypothetical protein
MRAHGRNWWTRAIHSMTAPETTIAVKTRGKIGEKSMMLMVIVVRGEETANNLYLISINKYMRPCANGE